MPGSVWEDEELKSQLEGNTSFKFDDVGDRIEGTLLVAKKKRFPNGLALELTWVEDDVAPLTAGQVMLMRSLFALQPGKGDHLAIELGEIEKEGRASPPDRSSGSSLPTPRPTARSAGSITPTAVPPRRSRPSRCRPRRKVPAEDAEVPVAEGGKKKTRKFV